MLKIKEYVNQIDEELEGAKCYAEKALMYKANNDNQRYQEYKSMANQELGHAETIHKYAVEEINKLTAVFPNPPVEMTDKWDHSHKEYIEKTAWIKTMLSM